MNTLTLALFKNLEDADGVIKELATKGFKIKEVSIIMKETKGNESLKDSLSKNMIGEGIATGAIIGGIAGLLIGIAAIIVPGIGGLIVAGPISTLWGITATAATTTLSGAILGALEGGLVGALVELGLPEEDALNYEKEINQGAILIAVPTTKDNQFIAKEIFQKYHAFQSQTIKLVAVKPS